MQLPVYLEGKRVGELTLVPQGRFWQARVQMADAARVVRLSIYGGGASVYLGIPEPDGHGGMTLSRTLRALPEGACCCAERAMPAEADPAPDAPPGKREQTPRHVVWMGGRAYYF